MLFRSQQVDNIRSGKSEEYLKAIVSIAEEANTLFYNAAPLKYIGELLDEQWKYKRQLTDDVTNDYIDRIYKKAMNAGAYGGKLMGAGGGGFFLFYVTPDKRQKVIDTITNGTECKIYDFKFTNFGSRLTSHS